MPAKRTKNTETVSNPAIEPRKPRTTAHRAPRTKRVVDAEVSPPTDTNSLVAMHEEISKLAYQYWLDRGCAHGSDEQDWLRAEAALAVKLRS